MRIGSLFDGIGGFPLAALKNGITPVWASEIEKFPIEVTKKHFPDMRHLGDITQINGAEIDPVDVITFGSPCQDLSVAGKRVGLEGERSGLFAEAIRIIKEMRGATDEQYPRFAVWENVPGAFSSNGGQDFRAVLESFANTPIPMPVSGGWANAGVVRTERVDIAWRVLDAQYWGVPQRRRRIFLIADFGGQSAPEILFKREGLSRHIEKGGKAREGTAGDVEGGFREAKQYLFENHSQDTRYIGPLEVSPIISATFGMGGNNQPFVVKDINCQPSGIAGTVSSKWAKGTGGPAGDEHYNLVTTPYQKTVGALCAADCKGMQAQMAKQEAKQDKYILGQHYSVRRLTPTECLRLQFFPDWWLDIEGASDTAKYKAIGNSVAIVCVDFIMAGIAEVLLCG